MNRLQKIDSREAALEEVQLLWEAVDRLLLLIQIHELGPPGIRGLREDLKAHLDAILEEYKKTKEPSKPKPKSFWEKFFGG
ncbi:MAG: hypothetical protein ACXAC5_03815 [Promethearchaeota archaeon]|jgi:hypothetical protein